MATKLEARLEKLSNAQLVTIYNNVAERQVAKFSDHTTAVKRVAALLETSGKDFTIDADGATITVGGAAPARDADDRRIKILVETNPKGTGTKGRQRFDLYRNGMTVGEFVRGVQALKGCGSRREAIRQIAWDLDHGYISLG